MIILELDLPRLEPWSTNDERTMHRMRRHQLHAGWMRETYRALKTKRAIWDRDEVQDHIRESRGIVQVTIPFDTNRRRDPHNYCGTVTKAVIDGLKDQKARSPRKGDPMVVTGVGLWPDDDEQYVGHREPILVVDPEKLVVPMVRVQILTPAVRHDWQI